MSDRFQPQTIDEAKALFRDAADAAEAKLPKAVARKLTAHLRDIAETCDFESAVGSLVATSWHQCAVDLIKMRGVLEDPEG